MEKFIHQLTSKLYSVLDNITYLDIEASKNSNKIKLIGVKFFNNQVYTFEETIDNNDKNYKINSLNDFIGDSYIAMFDLSSNKKFIENYINEKILDVKELVHVIKPYYSDYNIKDLNDILTNDKYISDLISIVNIVNNIIISIKKEDKLTLEPLTFKINSYLNKFSLPNWEWSELIDSVDDIKKLESIEKKAEEKLKDDKKEKLVIRKLNENERNYEELLKDESIWAKKEGFIYEYRPGQYELTKTIRETISSATTYKIACIEAPTGIGKSVGYLLPAILEARLNKKRMIISTDTKELQIQLINKDIPNVLNSLGLMGKIKYGYIKGKNNYICVEKLEQYKHEYTSKKPTKKEILGILLLEQIVKEGKHGDIEEISPSILSEFNVIGDHIRHVSCDPNLCRPKKCNKECLYKNRVEELKEEDITVINHSLLAKWPYKEEKPLENIIVDEGHNLAEKGYDFFSSTIEYKALKYFLREIYPYEYIGNSPFIYEKYKTSRKIKYFDKFYHHVHFGRDIKEKISRNINLILEELNSILRFGMESDYNYLSKYNLRWEFNLQQNEVLGKIKKEDEYIKLTYLSYSNKIRDSFDKILRNLIAILVIIDRNIDDDSIDKESDIYKFGKARIKELEDIRTTFELFMEFTEEDDFARIIEIDKNYTNFEAKVVPLKLAKLFEENILSQVESGIFISATLSVENNMNYFKNTLGINRVENIEKVIEPLYNYKNKVLTLGLSDLSNYNNKNFTTDISNTIYKICEVTHGHLLSLFNSTDRLDKTYEDLTHILNGKNIDIYKNKKGIRNLKNMNQNCVVLGSKGCFEGVDVPGDGLVCVTLDKIPNLNPKDPLYSTIMKKYGSTYQSINYPQMAIKVKQAMGRILRSKYDYGCFIIFDIGTNGHTLKKLERDLHGCKINIVSKNNIQNYTNNHLNICRRQVMREVLVDVRNLLTITDIDDIKDIEQFVVEQMNQRYIKCRVTSNNHDKLNIKYFNHRYTIPKEKIKLKSKV